jgi:hypothetical protein
LENDVNRKKIKAGPGKQWVEGKNFRLAKEIKYIQRRAAEHDGVLLQTELENRELTLNYSRPERTSLDER